MASSLNSQLHDVIVTSSVLKVIAIIQDPKRTLWDLRNVRIRKRFLSSVQKRILQGDPIYGLEDDKRDLVLMGTVFFIDLIEFLKKDSLRICPWSIREAYVLEYSKS
jgi:exopolyphosphatase/pppGpp-phosphohydrolase